MTNIGITSILAATATAGLIAAPLASAETTVQTQTLGSQGQLVDGAVIQGWTVSDLKPSSDAIPYPVRGTLWEATATDQAIQGSVTPIVSNLNARAADGQTYRVLFGVATPQGVNPSTLAPGQETSGKVYFDVTGATPDSVVYNAGGQDLLIWTPPPPSSSTGPSSTSYGSGSYAYQEPVTAAPTEAAPAEAAPPEGTTAAPAATGTEAPLPEGSQGTPLPEGSQGTPLPEGSQGTPLPEGSQGTPIAPAEAAPVPAGSAGTPLPAGDEVPVPTTYTPAPTP